MVEVLHHGHARMQHVLLRRVAHVQTCGKSGLLTWLKPLCWASICRSTAFSLAALRTHPARVALQSTRAMLLPTTCSPVAPASPKRTRLASHPVGGPPCHSTPTRPGCQAYGGLQLLQNALTASPLLLTCRAQPSPPRPPPVLRADTLAGTSCNHLPMCTCTRGFRRQGCAGCSPCRGQHGSLDPSRAGA
jgi:hypothetical protein